MRTPRHAARWIALSLLFALLAVASPGPAARAATQDADDPDAASSPAPASPAAPALTEVLIQPLTQVLGARVRPGEITPFLFSVTDRGTTIRNVLVRLDTIDLDGDTPHWSRPVTTTPGKPVAIWIYARLPFQFDTLTVSAFDAVERTGADPDDPSKVTYDAGRRLGSTSFRAGNPVAASAAMMLIVGPSRGGLEAYANRAGQQSYPALGHEIVEIIPGVKPAEIPDRAMGLRGYDALVWTGAGADEQPARLSVQQADALREWIAAGGHLVIVLPTVGQTWLESIANPLADIMPRVAVTRRDNVDLAAFRSLLTRTHSVEEQKRLRPIEFPSSTILHAFEPLADAGPYDAMPILASPPDDQGRRDVVVTRRLFGAGAVTIIGLDLNHPALTGDSLRADFFWHRILGRAGDLSSSTAIADRVRDEGLKVPGSRDPDVPIDEVIDYNIQREGRSAGGLLLALVVFGAFWLVACPLSFFVLKKRRRAHHAWLAFAGTIGLFTAISWTGASLLRQRQPDARFVAIIDHVYGQPTERARVWANLFLPEYGSQRVGVSASVAKEAKWRPILVPWEPASAVIGSNPFPDVRGYSIDSRSPESIAFPSRSTERRVQIDWVGPPKWSMPLPLPPPNDDAAAPVFGSEIQLQRHDPPVGGRSLTLVGTLEHRLPQPLEDVLVILVTGQKPLAPYVHAGQLLADAQTWVLKEPWTPGTPLVLDTLTQRSDGIGEASQLLSSLLPQATSTFGLGDPAAVQREMKGNPVKYLRAISLFNLIPMPILTGSAHSAPLIRRESTHNFDICRWFTQPCVIIIGHIRGGAAPIPITVDGKEIQTSGHTVVRWIYPLAPNPPDFRNPDSTPTPP